MFERVLVPTDFSEVSRRVIEWLPSLKRLGLGEVILVYVINKDRYDHPASGFDVSKLMEEEERFAREKLKEYVEKLGGEGVKASFIDPPPFGNPETEIIRIAGKIGAALIVLGSKGRGWLREKIFGSVAEAVIRHSPIPVLVHKVTITERAGEKSFHLGGEDVFSRMLVAYDFSESSEKALRAAVDIAARINSEVVVVHVFEKRDIAVSYRRVVEKELRGMVSELRLKGVNAEYVLRTGTPHKEIIGVAREKNVTSIFMGFKGPESFLESLLMGSTADAILRYSHVPVMVFK